jgi:FAD/FMN-containing dehydrogenase
MTIATPTHSSIQSGPGFEALSAAIAGEVITPGHPEFSQARTMTSLLFDHHPAAIVRCAAAADVATAVRFARANNLEVSLRSGGHSVSGHSVADGALVIDMSRLNDVFIDPEARTARVQPGARTRDVMMPAHAHSLALTTGDTASVGIGGLTTGGGIGWMVRKYGLTIDSLLSARIVTADGDEVVASPDENQDLFWAIRGGGGNFGIVTEFEFRLAPVGQVLTGVIMLPARAETIRAYLDYAVDAPDDLTTISFVGHAPPAPFVPEHRIGEPSISIHVVWTGSIAEGEKVLAPIRALAEPIADTVAPAPYPVIYEYTAPAEEPHLATVRSMFSDEISDEAIESILEAVDKASSPFSFVQLRPLGGALADVGNDETAFAHRGARFLTLVLGLWLDPEEDRHPHFDWTEDLWAKVRGEGNGVYVNFVQEDDPERLNDAYPPATMARLQQVKAKYDPDNFFRFNRNILPAR